MTMFRFLKGPLTVIGLAAAAIASATAPPPRLSNEEILCRADLVVVGSSTGFHLVRLLEIPGLCKQFDPQAAHLDHCTAVEVTVQVEKVIYPRNRALASTIQYRFGGGLFSTARLREDLEGRRMIFHLVADSEAPLGTYTTSYPWRLGMPEDFESRTKEILEACAR